MTEPQNPRCMVNLTSALHIPKYFETHVQSRQIVMPNFFPTSVEFMKTISFAPPQLLPMFFSPHDFLVALFSWMTMCIDRPAGIFAPIQRHINARKGKKVLLAVSVLPKVAFPLQVKPELIPGVGLSETQMSSFWS